MSRCEVIQVTHHVALSFVSVDRSCACCCSLLSAACSCCCCSKKSTARWSIFAFNLATSASRPFSTWLLFAISACQEHAVQYGTQQQPQGTLSKFQKTCARMYIGVCSVACLYNRLQTAPPPHTHTHHTPHPCKHNFKPSFDLPTWCFASDNTLLG
jgi:hypothetical protein